MGLNKNYAIKGKGLSYVNEIKYAKIYFRNKHALHNRESVIQTINTRGTMRLTL